MRITTSGKKYVVLVFDFKIEVAHEEFQLVRVEI
jgi:hypothetical protein